MLDSQQLFDAVLRFQSSHELFDDDFPFCSELIENYLKVKIISFLKYKNMILYKPFDLVVLFASQQIVDLQSEFDFQLVAIQNQLIAKKSHVDVKYSLNC